MKRLLLSSLLVLMMSLSAAAGDLASDIYTRLMEDHSPTFEAGKWVADRAKTQPDAVIAVLRKMLLDPETVEGILSKVKRVDGSTLTNEYPNNVVWALAQVPREEAYIVLKQFIQKDLDYGFNRIAALAATINEVRWREKGEYAALGNPGRLYPSPGSPDFTPLPQNLTFKIVGTVKGYYHIKVLPVGLGAEGYIPIDSPLI